MEAGFFEGSRGRIFHVLYEPTGTPCRGCVLYVHPLAEELNKSRRMSALLGRQLAAAGYAVMMPDLYGCGDSEGDFSEARWGTWLEDLAQSATMLRTRFGGPLTLMGLRSGCLLVRDLLAVGKESVAGIVFWQPVASGELALVQFLRMRMAAGMIGGNRETTTDLRRRLEAGETLEVGGYRLAPPFARELAGAQLLPQCPCDVHWFELAQGENAELSPGGARAVENWREHGCEVHTAVIEGDPFWNTHDITEVPALLERTLHAVATLSARAHPERAQWTGDEPPEQRSTPWHAGVEAPEQPVRFNVEGETLLGVLHQGDAGATRGVLVLVGGPQYRVGSHRQFLLLARRLAAAGVPVLRFDYRGMGDSEGAIRDFETVGEDIRGAIDCFQARMPNLRTVIVWGLCDAASAALIHAWRDPRVEGLILLNPWVRTQEGLAKAYLKSYYLRRLASRDFWMNLLQGRVNPFVSLRSLLGMTSRVIGANRPSAGARSSGTGPLPERMSEGWRRFEGPIQLILSGEDLTAAEFRETATTNGSWAGLLEQSRVSVHELPEANHTFSHSESRTRVEDWNLSWIQDTAR